MASVVVTPTAQRNLDTLIRTHSLLRTTRARVAQSLEQLRLFPLVGATLPRRRPELRFVLGPWRWMIVVYRHYEDEDQVRVISVHDARSARSPTSSVREREKVMADGPPTKQQPNGIVNEIRQSVARWRADEVVPT